MKHMKRTNTYKASNVTFDPETMEAYSYGWWRFVERTPGGQILFNDYNYSNSTCKHQIKVRRLMRELFPHLPYGGNLTIEAPNGLQDLDSAIKLYKERIKDLVEQIMKPRSHKRKNVERNEEIEHYLEKIRLCKSLKSQREAVSQ